jgi:hypothetical protein
MADDTINFAKKDKNYGISGKYRLTRKEAVVRGEASINCHKTFYSELHYALGR